MMTHEEARKIANYVLPRLLHILPIEMKLELLRRKDAGNEESLLEKLTAKIASDIHWAAAGIENEKRERYV